MNGLVVSKGVRGAFEREAFFCGDAPDLMAMLFMAARREGVRGVWTSERERWREGVFGTMVEVWKRESVASPSSRQTRFQLKCHLIVHATVM